MTRLVTIENPWLLRRLGFSRPFVGGVTAGWNLLLFWFLDHNLGIKWFWLIRRAPNVR